MQNARKVRFVFLALALGAPCIGAGCTKRKAAPVEAPTDAAPFERPADHLGAHELVPNEDVLLGMPLPKGFRKVDDGDHEAAAQGEATLEELRRHVLEHTMNAVARPEEGALAWSDAEIPGRGSTRFSIRVTHDGRREATLVVREEPAPAAVDGGSGAVLRAMGLDGRGYPTDYEQLR